MLEYLTLILACQLLGEFAVGAAGIPIPGPVVGMVILFLILLLKGSVPDQLANVSAGLLNNLSLMFVPAGVGVMVHFKVLGNDALPISVALVISTLLTIAVTALLMSLLNKASSKGTANKVTLDE